MRQDKRSMRDLVKSKEFSKIMSTMQKQINEHETVQMQYRTAEGEYSTEEALELAEAYNSGKNTFPELQPPLEDAEEFDYSTEEALELAEAYNSGKNTFPELQTPLEDVEESEYSTEEALELAEAYNSGKNTFPELQNPLEDAEESEYSTEEALELAEAYNNGKKSFSRFVKSKLEDSNCSENNSEVMLSEDEKSGSKNGTLKNEEKKAKALDISKEPAYQYALKIMHEIDLRYLDEPECSSGVSKFNGLYWEILSDEQLKDIVYQYITEADKKENDNIDGFCKNVATFIKYEARKLYSTEGGFSEKEFRKIQNRIVFRNLIYDAEEGKTLSFSPKLPYFFAVDADYVEEDLPTPFYDKLKFDATDGDQESMDMIDLMIAYLLIPNRSGKCFFAMANARDSGKSLLGQFICNLYIGNKCKSIDPEHLSGRFAFSSAGEATLLSCLEMNTDRLKKSTVAQIKRITGEQKIRSEAKYKDEKTLAVRFKLLLATNGGILLPEGMIDPAFYRRLIVIPFIKSTPLDSLIANLDNMIWKERDAIVSKCVRKLRRIINDDGGIVFPESELSKKMKQKWMGGINYDDSFIKNAFDYTGDPKDRVALADLDLVYDIFLSTKDIAGTGGVKTERKSLITKILLHYPGTVSKKERVKRIIQKEVSEKISTDTIIRIKWNEDFLNNIGFR